MKKVFVLGKEYELPDTDFENGRQDVVDSLKWVIKMRIKFLEKLCYLIKRQ